MTLPTEERFLEDFAKLINYYGGVIDYEFNLGTFWWENEHGQVYTLIVQGLDELWVFGQHLL